MPELPEVEVLRRDLERDVVGKKIKSVEVKGTRAIRRNKTKKIFIDKLTGKKITGVSRKGKYLLLSLDSKDVLVIHLGMSGQLLRAATARETLPKHTHVIIVFTQGGQLRFVDPRTFGEMFVSTPEELTQQVDELSHLGFDPIETAMSWDYFAQLAMSRNEKLKALLMDQKFIAGVGNIYSDEILHAAGLRYDREMASLTPQEMRRLYRSIAEVLQEAVRARGSTLEDEGFVDLQGKPGQFQELHQVYAREGQVCNRCRATIVREKFGNRSTFYCPSCQV